MQKLLEIIQNITKKLKKRFCPALRHHWVRCLVMACLFAFVADVLNLRSLSGAVVRMIAHPQIALMNFAMILLVVSLSCLFRRQLFATVMCFFPWIVVTVGNFLVQCYRATPMSAVDFALIPAFLGILDYYFEIWQLVLFAVAILLLLASLVLLYFKSKKKPREIRQGLSLIVACGLALAVTMPLYLSEGIISKDYHNLNKAYKDYGLPYCFAMSVFDRGINKPEDYSDETVGKALDDIEESMEALLQPDELVKPNVIFLQLESFVDAAELVNLSYTEAPTPYFAELKASCPSGYLTVPTYGAGTVNTEFEVITGMDLLCFGAGEYPYTTVLKERTCESMAYNLKENGYFATAIHNNTATFYDRNLVFPNLGFDRFVAEEFMQISEYTSVGWPKDTALLPEIIRSLEESDGPDFIYAISVQPHGKYPTDPEETKALPIQITRGFASSEKGDQTAYTYYVNQLREVDEFLRTLTEALSQWQEPTMLVLFGDHLPNFDMEESAVKSGDLFKAEYAIWTNYALSAEDRDLSASQLSSHALRLANCDNGIINRLHQSRIMNGNYQGLLELLQYDMLFGDQLVYQGENPYAPTELQLGFGDLHLDTVEFENETLTVKGSGFTAASVVFYNEQQQDTRCIDSETLTVYGEKPSPGARITVRQMASDGMELLQSNVISWLRNRS